MLHSMSRSWGSGSGQTTSSTSSSVTLNRRISLRYAHHLASLTKKQRVAQLNALPETGFLVPGHNPISAFLGTNFVDEPRTIPNTSSLEASPVVMRINIRGPCREFWNYIGVRLILTGREPVMRISTSLLALCCQLGLDATLETPIRARSRSSGSRSLLISPLSMARSTSA